MKRGTHNCNDCCKYCDYITLCPHTCFPAMKCKTCENNMDEESEQEKYD